MPKLVRLVAQRVAMIGQHHFAVRADGAEDHKMAAGAERADLGHLRRTEAAREGELALVGHLLAAKDQNRMLLERRARRHVGGVVGRDVAKRHAAQLGVEAWTKRDDVHRQVLPSFIFWPVSYRPMFGLIFRAAARSASAPALSPFFFFSGVRLL